MSEIRKLLKLPALVLAHAHRPVKEIAAELSVSDSAVDHTRRTLTRMGLVKKITKTVAMPYERRGREYYLTDKALKALKIYATLKDEGLTDMVKGAKLLDLLEVIHREHGTEPFPTLWSFRAGYRFPYQLVRKGYVARRDKTITLTMTREQRRRGYELTEKGRRVAEAVKALLAALEAKEG